MNILTGIQIKYSNFSKQVELAKTSAQSITKSTILLKKTFIKRSKLKREAYLKEKKNIERKKERTKRIGKEKSLESSTKGNIIGRPISSLASKAKAPFDAALNAIGYLVLGWLVNNLPNIIKTLIRLKNRIIKVVDSLQGLVVNVVSWLKGFGNLIKAYSQNIASLDFFDSQKRIENAQKEISESFGGIQQELDNFIKGVSTPLNESDDDPEDRKVSGSGDIDASSISADTPEEKAFIATVRELEGTVGSKGYNTWFGGRSDMDLSQMTVSEVVAEQKRRLSEGEATYSGLTSAAVGAGQFMKPEETVMAMGLDPNTVKYTPELQNKMILFQSQWARGIDPSKRLTENDMQTLGNEWASFTPRYGQTTRTASESLSIYNKNLKEAKGAGDGNKSRLGDQTPAYDRAVSVGRSLEAAGYRAWQHPDFNVNTGYTGSGNERVMMRSYNSYHNYGEALDYPLSHNSEQQLDYLAKYFRQNKEALGVAEILWRTGGHYDHLHVSFKGGGSVTPMKSNMSFGSGLSSPKSQSSVIVIEEESPPTMPQQQPQQQSVKTVVINPLNSFIKTKMLLDLAYT